MRFYVNRGRGDSGKGKHWAMVGKNLLFIGTLDSPPKQDVSLVYLKNPVIPDGAVNPSSVCVGETLPFNVERPLNTSTFPVIALV